MCPKFLIFIFSFLVMSKKTQKIFSKFYIDNYFLRQYLRILTHPIIHFLHFGHYPIFPIYLKKISPKSQWGGLTPKTPLSYASGLPTTYPASLHRVSAAG